MQLCQLNMQLCGCFLILLWYYKQNWWDKRIAFSVVKYWHGKYCVRAWRAFMFHQNYCYSFHCISYCGKTRLAAAVALLVCACVRHLTGSITLHFLYAWFCRTHAAYLLFSIICIRIIGSEQMWFSSNFYLFFFSVQFVRFCIYFEIKFSPVRTDVPLRIHFPQDDKMHYSVCVCRWSIVAAQLKKTNK